MSQKPIYILGISESHTASAALLKDGQIIAAAAEERFTRQKLQPGIPKNAIKFCLDLEKIKHSDLTSVAISDITPPIFDQHKIAGKPQQYSPLTNLLFDLEESIERRFPPARSLFFSLYKKIRNLNLPISQQKRQKALQRVIPLPQEKFSYLNHHTCHAAAALFSSQFPKNNQPVLVFTADGVGDFESATIHKYQNGQLKKLVSIDSQQSLGFFYLHITQFLGMKPIEDEYKVMGLAPYAKGQNQEIYQLLRPYFDFKMNQNCWTIKVNEVHLARKLPQLLAYRRFDQIAAAAQKITEEILSLWVGGAIDYFQIANIACGGGVFANIKVNQKISKLPNVKSAFFMPSPSDDSNAIGAAFYAYFESTASIPKPLEDLYLGPSYTVDQIEKELTKNQKKYNIQKPKDINQEVADLLSKGEVVARFSGRMEFGARALGNRSILSRPDNLSVVSFINNAIKQRDFWMPFAPTILRDRARDYLVLHKADSTFMNVAFDTTEKGKIDLSAAIHPYDKTTRPQILDRDANPKYYDLIKKFEKLTGIGAVLNTSFNLHGEPIVCTPTDALNTFKKSKLKYLIIEKWLITKR